MILQINTHFVSSDIAYLSATILTLIGILIAYKSYKKKVKPNFNPKVSNRLENNNSNSLTVNMGNFKETSSQHLNENQSAESLITDIKKVTHILFIDDDTKFNIVKILKNEGWENTKSITDLKSYNETKLLMSQIVFVDIQGVGRALECKEEGLGLALNIKNQYPQKKVIIYSAIQSHKVFHEAIKKVDFLLSKDAEPIQFISLVEKFSLEIK